MKTIAATKASKNFGSYLDAVQREPVIITKKNRPVAVTYSIERAKELFNFQVSAGIQKGLDDVAAGKTKELTPDYISEMKREFKAKHARK